MKTIIPEIVYQGETNECGLACISILAETQGVDLPLEKLRKHYPASSHGTSLATLSSILEENNIPVYPVQFEYHELGELPLPAILHYGASHYVLLAWRKGNYVCVMNPGVGEQVIPVHAMKMEISGYALILDESRPAP